MPFKRFTFLTAFVLLFPASTWADNITTTEPEREQQLKYFVRDSYYGTSSPYSGTLRTTDGRLDLEFATSGSAPWGDPWSTTATAHLTNDYTLETTGETLDLSGSLRTDLTFIDVNPPSSDSYLPFWSSYQAWNASPPTTGGGNVFAFNFTVERYWVEFVMDFTILESTGAQCYVKLLRQDPYSAEAAFTLAESAVDEDLAASGILTEGNYLLVVAIVSDRNTAAEVNFSLALEPDPDDPLITDPPPGGYQHPEVGTVFEDSPRLIVRNPSIVAETDLGDGTTQLEVTVELENTGTCHWGVVTVSVPQEVAGEPEVTTTINLSIPALEPGETAPSPEGETIGVIVDNADLEAVRASLLDGSRFSTYGRELWSFKHPPKPYDFHSDHYGGDTLWYENPPPVGRGDILVAIPALHPVPPVIIDGSIPPLALQGIDARMPFLVHDVVPPDPGDALQVWEIAGEQVNILEHMTDGTHISTLPRLHPSSGVDSTGYHGVYGPTYFPHPIHFNRIPISDTIEISGSFAMVPDDFRVEIEMVGGLPKGFFVEGTMVADCNFLIEVGAETNNTGDTAEERSRTIADFPLFVLVLPSGITFTPEFKFELSAAIEAEAGISIPINAGMEVIFRGGYDDGAPVYDCEVTPLPQRVTRPTIFSAANASVEIEALAQLAFMFQIPEAGAVSFGPTFGAAVIADFGLDALADPAWDVGADLELRGGMEFDLLGFFNLVDLEHPLFTTPLFQNDSGAPLGGPPATHAFTPSDNPGLKPIEGDAVRWVRVLQPLSNTSATTDMFVTPLVCSDDIITGASTTTNGELACYGPDGALRWMLNATYLRPIAAVADPGGTFTVLSGSPSKIQLTRFDHEGNILWAKAYSISGCEGSHLHSTVDLVRGENALGAGEYFVLGRGSDLAPPFYRFPSLFKFDSDGEPIWQKAYRPAPEDTGSTSCELGEAIITKDGHLAFVGVTYANIIGTGSSELQNLGINVTYNGLAAKVDTASGELLWSTIIASERIPTYTSMAEDPDGNLFLGGSTLLTVYDATPSMIVSKLSADGSLVDTVLIGHQTPNLGGESAQLLAGAVPQNGQSLVDYVYDMVWVDDALWIGGQIGIFNSGVSYIDGSSAFTARVSPDLGVSRFVIHAGPAGDHIRALADGGDGLLAFGSSSSFLPWPQGAASEAEDGPTHRILLKLPWEGMTRFHSLSGGAQPPTGEETPVRGTFFVYPWVVAASDTDAFAAIQNAEIPSEDDHRTTTTALPFSIEDLTLATGSTAYPPSFVEPAAHHALEYVPESIVDSTAEYLAWAQLDPEADEDGDTWDTGSELFFGTDPFVFDGPRFEISALSEGDTMSLELAFPRAAMAEGELPVIEVSLDLDGWFPLTGHILSSETISAELDWIRASFALSDEAAEFYRVSAP